MAIFTFTNVAVLLTTLYLARRTYWELTTGTQRRAIIKQHGCLKPKRRLNRRLPKWLPDILGLDFILANMKSYKAKRMLDDWSKDLNDIDSRTGAAFVLGETVFFTKDPENIKCILATSFDTWSLGKDRIEQMSKYLGYGIFTNEGKAWKHSREMLRPCFERSAVADVSVFDKHTERFLNLLPKDGTEVDLQPLFHELTLDIATEFLFGRSTNSLDRGEHSEEVQAFIEAFEYCNNPFSNESIEKWGNIGIFLPDKKWKRSVKLIQDFTDKVIDEELRSKSSLPSSPSEKRYIFLDELVAVTSDRTVIRSELLNILLAGRDTTAALLSNILWDLPRHPTILSRLRAEIADVVGPATPTYDQLKDLKYLRAIINESQRLYPIVPVNSREALRDTTIPRGGGADGQSPLLVPKGNYVSYFTHSMHRDESLYGADAHEFRPERWLDAGFRPGWSYIPFSGGPRVCIGQNFALTEAMFVVVRLVQECEFERKDFDEWIEKLTITCTGNGCRMGLRRRGE